MALKVKRKSKKKTDVLQILGCQLQWSGQLVSTHPRKPHKFISSWKLEAAVRNLDLESGR